MLFLILYRLIKQKKGRCMKVIGLTGMSGSGKTYVSQIFASYGVHIINFDELVHHLYAGGNACTQALAEAFGTSVLTSDHAIDRKTLGRMVFSDEKRLEQLNRIVYPFVLEEYEKICTEKEAAGVRTLLLDAPTLFEAGCDRYCDFVVAVVADPATRIQRIELRDSVNAREAERRLSHQHNDLFFQQRCKYIIRNSPGQDPVPQVEQILRQEGILP